MTTIKINNLDKASVSTVKRIARVLEKGKIAILPASTIYGLSCRYNSKKSIEKIYKIKKRDRSAPFIILVSSRNDIKNLASEINRTAEKIMEKFWDIKNPRPLTLIFKRNSSLEDFVTAGSPNIALRPAGSGFLRNIIKICGPIVSTSATISGIKGSPKEIKDIPGDVIKQVDLIVECSSALPGTESTVIDVTGKLPVPVREGVLKFSDILE